MNPDLNTLSMDLTEMLVPWIAILISISLAFWFKDFVASLIKGLKFRMNSAFQEGDHVILDGEQAIIVKIGISNTVFGIHKENEDYVWRYVPNERIPYLKLEKVVKKDLHLDSEEEKAERLKGMIDKIQDQQIAKNQEAIEKMKNE